MALGPGKYDDLATEARRKAEAHGVVLIVIGGKDGHGMSCQSTPMASVLLPRLLREIANEIEADLALELLEHAQLPKR